MANENMNQQIKQINDLINIDRIERRVFLSVHALITDRIFNKGKDSQNRNIGRYSNGYVKRRLKNNWGASKKVILQFTGQMKNDFSLIRKGDQYGSGFKNIKNGDKSRWVESTYEKEIFSPTRKEIKEANTLYASELNKYLRRG